MVASTPGYSGERQSVSELLTPIVGCWSLLLHHPANIGITFPQSLLYIPRHWRRMLLGCRHTHFRSRIALLDLHLSQFRCHHPAIKHPSFPRIISQVGIPPPSPRRRLAPHWTDPPTLLILPPHRFIPPGDEHPTPTPLQALTPSHSFLPACLMLMPRILFHPRSSSRLVAALLARTSQHD
jgi:hypothetical protein